MTLDAADVGPNGYLCALVQTLAKGHAVRLAPDWAAAMPDFASITARDMPARVSNALGWDHPYRVRRKPRAHAFPLMINTPGKGWEVVARLRADNKLIVAGPEGPSEIPWSRKLDLWAFAFTEELRDRKLEPAINVFWRALRNRPRMLFEATLATVVVNVMAMLTSVYSMQVYDRVIPLHSYSTLTVLTFGMLGALALDFALRNVRAAIVDRETDDIDAEINEYFFERMQAVRMDSRPPGVGTMAGQLGGLVQVRAAMTSTSMFTLADLPFALVFMFFMMSIGGGLAFVPLIFLPISLILAVVLARGIRQATSDAQLNGNHKHGLLVEAIDAAETLKASGGDWFMLRAWNRLVEKQSRNERRIRRWNTFASTTFAALPQLSYVVTVCFGTYLVANNTITMGQLIACTIIGGRVTGPLVSALPSMIIQWSYARDSLRMLDGILAMPSAAPIGRPLVELNHVTGHLKLEDASFSYPGGQPVVKTVNLTVEPGEKIGIIGAVGSGKSSLLKMLGGLYAPTQGIGLIDGMDMSQTVEFDLRRHICYLPQNYRLIGGTLRDNLSMGLSDVSDEQLLEAAGRTGLGDLIRKNPKGLDMVISEGGRGLSGGQGSLVGLTRILLLKPKVLLLDEPTAAMDQDTEARALNAIFATLGDTSTIVIVTHKIQLVSLVRRLIVMAHGKIALDGTPQMVVDRLRAPVPDAAQAPRPIASTAV